MAGIICGIDPGLSGAVAFYGDDLQIFDMPTHTLKRNGKNKRDLDLASLSQMLAHIGHAFVEQVGAMPGQGVSSVFSFGKSYGAILGILAAKQIPFTRVAPRTWKAALKVPAEKDGARARASELLPQWAHLWPLKKHDGRAEAALIAYYGARETFRAAA